MWDRTASDCRCGTPYRGTFDVAGDVTATPAAAKSAIADNVRSVSTGDMKALICDGAVRDIRNRGIEVVRSVDCPVRDESWAAGASAAGGFSAHPIHHVIRALRDMADALRLTPIDLAFVTLGGGP